MTNSNQESAPTDNAPTDPEDPRMGFAAVTAAVGELIKTTAADTLGNPTPCPEFTVKDLLEHKVMVMRRVAAIGRGEHWSSVDTETQDDGWHESFIDAAHQTQVAWTDPAKLEQVYEVPWGEIPGVPLMLTYTAELATHGWDLAHATGRDLTIDDDLLRGALMAIQFVPAEGRDHEDVPFSDVVDPGPDAPVLLQIAGWAGRAVV